MKLIVNWKLPIKTVSEANSSDHWTKAHKRHKLQKGWIRAFYLKERPEFNLPIHVELTRIAPRFLDADDNLPNSLKYVKDYVADLIIPNKQAGRADDSKQITWSFNQEQGNVREYGVKIKIYEVTCVSQNET